MVVVNCGWVMCVENKNGLCDREEITPHHDPDLCDEAGEDVLVCKDFVWDSLKERANFPKKEVI